MNKSKINVLNNFMNKPTCCEKCRNDFTLDPTAMSNGKFCLNEMCGCHFQNASNQEQGQLEKSIPEYNQEEWGGWKFVSEMLDTPDENRIYNTSKCYKQLYDFVVTQKAKAKAQGRKEGIEEAIEAMPEGCMYLTCDIADCLEPIKQSLKKNLLK